MTTIPLAPGFPPGFFTIEDVLADVSTDAMDALVSCTLDAWDIWRGLRVAKWLPMSHRTMGCVIADGVVGRLGLHSAVLPSLQIRTSGGRENQLYFCYGEGRYSFRIKLASTTDLRVRDTDMPANRAYLRLEPLKDDTGTPVPSRRLNLVHQWDVSYTEMTGIFLKLGRVNRQPIWALQLYGSPIEPYPLRQKWFDPIEGYVGDYTSYFYR